MTKKGRANFGTFKLSSSPFASKMSANQLHCHIINILLTELSRSVWENLDLGRVYRPHCVRSVLTTLVKILPYRPPARLIRAKYKYVSYKQLSLKRRQTETETKDERRGSNCISFHINLIGSVLYTPFVSS